MTHDPYQTYPTFGAYTGLTNPFSSPFTAMQTSAINPAAIPGVPNYAQQLQLAAALASQAAIPQMAGMSPVANAWQNPFIAAALQNPLVAAALQMQNPLLNQILAQLTSPIGAQLGLQPSAQFQQPYQQHQQPLGHAVPAFGQQIPPFAQFSSPLAPQSWVGQGLAGQVPAFGQVNPLLAQLAARGLQGGSPWSVF
jgi:hypothetical protein